MYISQITIKNYGPIESISIQMPFKDDHPLPLILVGQNGTGKTLMLATIINSLMIGRHTVFDDNDIESGKTYKFRSPHYIPNNKQFSYSNVKFQSDVSVEELQLQRRKSRIENPDKDYADLAIFQEMAGHQTSSIKYNYVDHPKTAEELFQNQCCLFFPVHRSEDPAWLNSDNMIRRANFTKLKRIARHSNRNFISTSTLESNRDWILDLLLDQAIYELKTTSHEVQIKDTNQYETIEIFNGYEGQATQTYDAILELLRIILKQGKNIRLGVGNRKTRNISIMKNEEQWIPSLFQLSTGEMQLLNLFLSILRDYDLADSDFKDLSDVRGIVVIDEIDTHLHTSHQVSILPNLIASFPKVQFIITTHSPLFLIGLKDKIGEDGFKALEMPNGTTISPEEFSDFGEAYETFIKTERHKAEIENYIKDFNKPIIFVEGDYDIRYLKRAAELLNKKDILENFNIRDGDGYGNLNNLWKTYDNASNEMLSQKLILLYDCDIKKPNAQRGKLYKRTMPAQPENPIKIGIENLFSEVTIEKIEKENPQFIDLHPETTQRVRNIPTIIPQCRSVNKDEKGNMCNWLCNHGTQEDFSNFEKIFQILSELAE